MKVQLRVISKNAKVKTVDLRGETLIGRGANCTLRVASSDVSREHCRICVAGSTVSIRDLGSANGTLVNGKAIAANENCELAPGSRIRVGPMRFVLNFDKQTDQIAKDSDEAVLADQVEVWDEFGDVDDTQDDITVALDPTKDGRDNTARLDDEEEVIIEATPASGIDLERQKSKDPRSRRTKSHDSKTADGVPGTPEASADGSLRQEVDSTLDDTDNSAAKPGAIEKADKTRNPKLDSKSQKSVNSNADKDAEGIIEAVPVSGIDVVEDTLTDSESLKEKSADSKTKLDNVTATEDPQLDDAVDAELESDVDSEAEEKKDAELESNVDSEAEEKKSDEETVFDFLEDPTPAEPVDEDELGGFLDQFDAE